MALNEIQDSVRDSGTMFVFGMANSGERVDEKSALQISTVYHCVRLLSETEASLSLHLYKILYRQANPLMTSFCFREAMMTHLLLWGNAYAQIVRNVKKRHTGAVSAAPGERVDRLHRER